MAPVAQAQEGREDNAQIPGDETPIPEDILFRTWKGPYMTVWVGDDGWPFVIKTERLKSLGESFLDMKIKKVRTTYSLPKRGIFLSDVTIPVFSFFADWLGVKDSGSSNPIAYDDSATLELLQAFEFGVRYKIDQYSNHAYTSINTLGSDLNLTVEAAKFLCDHIEAGSIVRTHCSEMCAEKICTGFNKMDTRTLEGYPSSFVMDVLATVVDWVKVDAADGHSTVIPLGVLQNTLL